MSALSSRLEALRKKKLESKQENKKDLYKDIQNQRVRSLNLKRNNDEEAIHEAVSNDKGEDARQRNLSYTLEECEDWESKKKEKREAKSRSSTLNYSDLAEQLYLKEVLKMDVDKVDFNKLTLKPNSKVNLTATTGNYSIHKPSKDKINALSKEIQDTQRKAQERREKNINSGNNSTSFINEKNKQFNMKLDRQYK